jgi:hypothetical protein
MLGGIAQAQVDQDKPNNHAHATIKGSKWMAPPLPKSQSSIFGSVQPTYHNPPSEISKYKFGANFDPSHFKANIPNAFKVRPMGLIDTSSSASNVSPQFVSWDQIGAATNQQKQKEFNPETFLNPSGSNPFMNAANAQLMLKQPKQQSQQTQQQVQQQPQKQKPQQQRGFFSKKSSNDANLRPQMPRV